MKVITKRALKDGTTLVLQQFCTNRMFVMGLRLILCRPGLDIADVRRIDQREGGIELLFQWTGPWNANPGPRARWTKVLAEGYTKFDELVEKLAQSQC